MSFIDLVADLRAELQDVCLCFRRTFTETTQEVLLVSLDTRPSKPPTGEPGSTDLCREKVQARFEGPCLISLGHAKVLRHPTTRMRFLGVVDEGFPLAREGCPLVTPPLVGESVECAGHSLAVHLVNRDRSEMQHKRLAVAPVDRHPYLESPCTCTEPDVTYPGRIASAALQWSSREKAGRCLACYLSAGVPLVLRTETEDIGPSVQRSACHPGNQWVGRREHLEGLGHRQYVAFFAGTGDAQPSNTVRGVEEGIRRPFWETICRLHTLPHRLVQSDEVFL